MVGEGNGVEGKEWQGSRYRSQIAPNAQKK